VLTFVSAGKDAATQRYNEYRPYHHCPFLSSKLLKGSRFILIAAMGKNT
jgi:hypothetical protein